MAAVNMETVRIMIAQALRPVVNRLDNYVQRAVIREVDDTLAGQEMKLDLGGEDVGADLDAVTVEQVESFEPYGITANPPAGTDCLLVSVGGASDNPIAIGVVNRDQRPNSMESGEVAVYGSAGVALFYDKDGIVYLANRMAAQFLARADRVDSELSGVKSHVDNHTHTVPISGPMGTTATTPPLTPMPPPGSTASDKVKGD